MSDEMEEFKTEIFETLERAETALLEFDKIADGTPAPALYDEVFRAYHNIKGAAGMMAWAELQHHVHQLENVLTQYKDKQSIPKALVGWFLKGNDATRAIMEQRPYEFDYATPVEGGAARPSAVETQKVVEANTQLPAEFYAEVNEGLEQIGQALLKMENGQGDRGLMDELYRSIHSIKGASQLFGLQLASELAHLMEGSLEELRSSQVYQLDTGHVNALLMAADLLRPCVQEPTRDDLPRELGFVRTLLEGCAAVVVKSEPAPVSEAPTTVAAKPVEPPKVQAPVTSESDKADSTIRVQVALLDRLMALMGEMVLVRNQVLQYSQRSEDLEFLNLSQKLDVVTTELQEETMKTRMQPIGNVLTKFQRVVRDLSASLNKKITLNMLGVETELDKTLIEAVKDPLTHIVRNACDHGIELPEERLGRGKPEHGTITIKAFHEGGQVIVDIVDDGKGLSREKLLKKALEKGIVSEAQAQKLTDREVQALIFAPGFSTAEKVTNVSGRGVGMDVVRSNIEKIGGLVDISSTDGEGTRITLKIPLTLAIVPAMIVRSQEGRFAIPQMKLVELVRIERSMIEMLQGKPIFRLRGNLLPLVDMREVLQQPAHDESEAYNIVVLNSDSQIFGLIVDEIIDTADIVVKPLAGFLKPISIYSGATVLGDGSVAFIMDVHGIASKHLAESVKHEAQALSDKYGGFLQTELAAREYVLVRLGSPTKHAIPLTRVSRMEEFARSKVELSGEKRVIRYRGSVLPLIDLNEELGYPAAEAKGEVLQVIVAHADNRLVGFVVDEIIDVLSTRDPLDSSVIARASFLGNLVTDQEIIVVLNVDEVGKVETAQSTHSTANRKRILFVEDTASVRQTIAQLIRAAGYEVEEAEDGIDALKKIAESRANFDLIVSDIEMPRMNGYDFARKVRGISKLSELPLIAFTTKNSPNEIHEAKRAGFTTLLEKSRARLLGALIEECLRVKEQRRSA